MTKGNRQQLGPALGEQLPARRARKFVLANKLRRRLRDVREWKPAGSAIPSNLDPSEGLGEDGVLGQQFCVFGDEGPEPLFGHVGDEVVEQASLSK